MPHDQPREERLPRVIDVVAIQCVCGTPVTGDTVGRAEAAHIRHLLAEHDLPAVNRAQYAAMLDRKDPSLDGA